MKIIIVGAGVVGSRLASVCCDDGHAVVVIEPDHEAAEAVAEACDALVLNANITDADIMEQAGADAKNLMAIVLARDVEIASLVAVVNDKGHRHMFERFGVRVLLEPEDLIAHHLLKLAERELDSER